jgi:hypothetical protein
MLEVITSVLQDRINFPENKRDCYQNISKHFYAIIMEKQVFKDRKGDDRCITESGLQVFGVWMQWFLGLPFLLCIELEEKQGKSKCCKFSLHIMV